MVGMSLEGCQVTPAVLSLWLALAGPPPDYYAVPSWPQSMEPIVSYWADAWGVQRSLAYRVFIVESSGNPRATGNEWDRVVVKGKTTWVRGKVLAEGAFMISVNPLHRKEHLDRAGMDAQEFDPWNVSDSARVGIGFLRYLLDYFPDIRASIAGYNCGRNGAARWYYGGFALSEETRRYLRMVLG